MDKRMTRKQALTTITAEVAQEGRATKTALRAYIECRVSFAAFQAACDTGLRIYQAQQARAREG